MMRLNRRASGVLMTMLAMVCAGALVRAAGLSSKYDAEMKRLRSEWTAAQRAEGLDPRAGRKTLYGKYPTPQVTLSKTALAAPGASVPLAFSGTVPAETTFLVDNDQVTLSGASTTAGKYSATAAIAAGAAMPGYARVFAYAPVSGAWKRVGAILINTTPTFALTGTNGWKITLTPEGRPWTTTALEASLAYKAEYFKPGATTPFETTTGALTLSLDGGPDQQLSFGMQAPTGGAMQEYQELAEKMGDPNVMLKMSSKEMDALQKKMEALSERMTKEMEQMAANASAIAAKQAEFGCGNMSLSPAGGRVTGYVYCGEKVGTLQLQGTTK